MYLLSLETSTKIFSLAVSRDEKVLRFRNIRTARILESSIITSIDGLLVSCKLGFKDIDTLAIGLGPGSFTSLRVGLSTIKAFALSSGKKVVGIGSLDVIASGVAGEQADEICVIVDARRGKVYAAVYDGQLNRKTDYLLTTIEDVLTRVQGTTLFVGDGVSLYRQHIEAAYKDYHKNQPTLCRAIFAAEKFWYPQSKELAKLALKRIKHKEFDNPVALTPVYLYPQDCQVTRK